MRCILTSIILIAVTITSVGCAGTQTKLSKREQYALDLIDQMNNVADGFDQGDATKIRTALAKLTEITLAIKQLNLDEAEVIAPDEKYKSKLEAAQERMSSALENGPRSGKLSPTDLGKITEELEKLMAVTHGSYEK